MYFEVALIAYITDRIVGEFSFIRHPVVIMGDYIKWFEKRFYTDSVSRGALLTLTLIFLTFLITHGITMLIKNPFLLGFLASTCLASKMLFDSVKDIIKHPKNIKFLVSRDSEKLTDSEINKAAIETYAENLSDGVVAPLFYLCIFGIEGAFIYKAINTLDSMVGYKNERYEKFGKFSAKLDDVVNYIPARITALFIAILMGSRKALNSFSSQAKKHESPNAGYPISAMGLSLGVMLGGDTSYFGKLKNKPCFGYGKSIITTDHIFSALSLQWRLDLLFIIFLGVMVTICIPFI